MTTIPTGASDQPLPPGLDQRPVDPRRHLPVPVMNMRPADPTNYDGDLDTADFTAIWAPTVVECGHKRLCGICGNPLGYWIAFLGGPKSATNRTYSDPPFHPACAEASLSLCPHIAVPHHQRAPDHRLAEGTSTPAQFDGSRTEEWVIGITRDYKMDVRRGAIVFTPAPFKQTRRFTYEGRTLVEVTP